jgi:hypothetical protein
MKFYKPTLKHTLFLHSNKAIITKNTAGSKNITYSWNIPPFQIDEMAEMQIGSIASINANSTAIYTFRVQTPMSYGYTNYCSDGGLPILFSTLLNNMNAMFRNDFGVILCQQNINNITLQVSDDYTDPLAGIGTGVNFVICIVIQEFQMSLQEISNPYQDAIEQVKRPAFNSLPPV